MTIPALVPGSKTTITVSGVDILGRAISGVSPSFSIDNSEIASVSVHEDNPSQADITANAVGVVTLTVTAEDITTTETVTVVEPSLTSFTVEASAPVVA